MSAGERTLYVYALTEPGMPRRVQILGHALRILTIGQVQVVVEYHEERPEATTESLREQHAVVVELDSRSNALLPARFGTVLRERALRSTVSEHEAEILQALARVRGRQQMTVRVFGAPDTARPVDDRTSTGTAFLESRRFRAHYIPAEAATIRTLIGALATAERVEAGERGLRVTVFHLVARQAVEAYRRQAEALHPALAPHEVTVTGPWPPFAFSPELL